MSRVKLNIRIPGVLFLFLFERILKFPVAAYIPTILLPQ